MAQVKQIPRVLLINGVELPIPKSMTADEAKSHYKPRYPSLTNSYIGEQRTEEKDGKPTKVVYEVTTKVGQKG